MIVALVESSQFSNTEYFSALSLGNQRSILRHRNWRQMTKRLTWVDDGGFVSPGVGAKAVASTWSPSGTMLIKRPRGHMAGHCVTLHRYTQTLTIPRPAESVGNCRHANTQPSNGLDVFRV